MRSRALILVCLLLSTACASTTPTQALLVSGDALDLVGTQFVQVGTLYNQLLDAKLVTPAQYQAWATFATRFKSAYPTAVTAWKTARAALAIPNLTTDTKATIQASQDQAAALVKALTSELATLAGQAYTYLLPRAA